VGSRAPNTPTLVCLHGLGRSLHDWDGVEAGLSRHGAVRAPALPRGGVNALMAATVDLPQHTILIGHSMAGVVALRSAAQAPDRVLGVLLTDSFFPPSRNGRGIATSVRDYGAHRIAVAREMATRGSRPRPSGGGARGLGSLARLGLRPQAFHRMAGHVRAPVLVVHARDDHHVPLDFALAAAARHPAWTVGVLDSGGHNAHVEQPREWLALTDGWLEGLASRDRVQP
jgi:pimeloyl-ACP methyl ester carboxylesterase